MSKTEQREDVVRESVLWARMCDGKAEAAAMCVTFVYRPCVPLTFPLRATCANVHPSSHVDMLQSLHKYTILIRLVL